VHGLDAQMVTRLLTRSMPAFQVTCEDTQNLGMGYLYYGIARLLRPREVVVIGSKAGFAPLCFALAVRDNEGTGVTAVTHSATEPASRESGHVDFIDPSYSVDRGDPNHSYGLGMWDDPEEVDARWCEFGVDGFITHFKMTSAEYLASVATAGGIEMLYVDGDHSYTGMRHDLVEFSHLLCPDAIVLVHDVHPGFEYSDGYEVLQDLPQGLYEAARLPIVPGLALLRRIGTT